MLTVYGVHAQSRDECMVLARNAKQRGAHHIARMHAANARFYHRLSLGMTLAGI